MNDPAGERPIHVLTLTPFYPYEGNEADGPFVAEPLLRLPTFNITSTVMVARSLSRPAGTATEKFPEPILVQHLELPGKAAYGSWGWFLYPRLSPVVTRLHGERPIDLIHAHAALPCGQAAAWLSRKLRIPFLVTTHGVDVLSTGRETGPSRWWCARQSRDVYRRADQNICVSELSRRMVRNGVGDAVTTTVVYNGVDTELFTPATNSANHHHDNSSLTILSVGRLVPVKAHDMVVRAMAKLTTEFPALRLDIIGEGDEQPRLLALARDLGVSERVRMLGSKSRREVAEAMRRCTVFALPSREEALGCVFLEAMATAKPAIACHGEGIAEIIRHGDNGWLVEPNNLEQVTEALSALLGDAALRKRLGEAGRTTILEQHTLEHQAAHLNQVYRECLEKIHSKNSL